MSAIPSHLIANPNPPPAAPRPKTSACTVVLVALTAIAAVAAAALLIGGLFALSAASAAATPVLITAGAIGLIALILLAGGSGPRVYYARHPRYTPGYIVGAQPVPRRTGFWRTMFTPSPTVVNRSGNVIPGQRGVVTNIAPRSAVSAVRTTTASRSVASMPAVTGRASTPTTFAGRQIPGADARRR